MDNISNITNSSSRRDPDRESYIMRVMICFLVFQFIFMVAGTFLNLWLVSSILTSKDLRVRLRNQLICNLSISYLLQSLIKAPAQIAMVYPYVSYDRSVHTFGFFCRAWGTVTMVEYAQSGFADWLIVVMMVVFLAQVLDLNPENKLTPQAVRICTVALHITPWVVIAIATPVAITTLSRLKFCLHVSSRHAYFFESVYTIIPIIAAVLLAFLTFVLRYRRFSRGSSTAGGNMGVQLLGRGTEVDSVLPYLVALALCIGCEMCNLLFAFRRVDRKYNTFDYAILSMLLPDSRVILMVLPWLILPDIRQRIRSWRPWKPQPEGIDLTMAYQKDES